MNFKQFYQPETSKMQTDFSITDLSQTNPCYALVILYMHMQDSKYFISQVTDLTRKLGGNSSSSNIYMLSKHKLLTWSVNYYILTDAFL